jgi:amino acid adenylation domain-containing protein
MNDLASRLDQLSPKQRELLSRVLEKQGARFGSAPLSFTQQRMWLLDRFDPGSPAYNVTGVLRLSGPLDVGALERAIQEIVRRHAALRTSFPHLDGRPVQAIHAHANITLRVCDASDVSAAQREQRALELAEEASLSSFDLARAPLIRCTLIHLGPGEHMLVTVIHHIVCDLWSLDLFRRELAVLYTAHAAGRESRLLAPTYQYLDFAQWQRQWAQGPLLDEQLQYWKHKLAGMPATLGLAADGARPQQQGLRGAAEPLGLHHALHSRLSELGQRHAATPFMIYLAAYAVLLSRMGGQEDVVIGSPIANRTRPELAGVIGYFLNTLLLRIDLSGRPSFAELLARVRETCLDAYAHGDVPFELLVEALQPERKMSRRPLFEALFILQNRPSIEGEMAGVKMSGVELPMRWSHADIGLWIHESGTGAGGLVSYDSDLFDQRSARRIADRYRVLLDGILASPQQVIDRLPLLGAEERREMVAWNATAADYPDACLHELIAPQAGRSPDHVAVLDERGSLTYRALLDQAHRLASHLVTLGVAPESRVAIMVERSTDLVVALLGTLLAGGAYVPLDPGYPRDRLLYMLEDSGAQVLITQSHLQRILGATCDAPLQVGATTVLIEDVRGGAWQTGEPAAPSGPGATPDSLAYVIYTSGSTGRPKGAMITHRSIVNRLLWMQDTYGLGQDDRVLQKTPSSFDVSVWELFWPLMTGATLVMARPDGHKDASYLVQLIRSAAITTLHFVPSMLRAFLEEPGLETCHGLRRVFCSGEALSGELVTRFFERSRAELHNLYGPTEAAVDVTAWQCRPGADAVIPIGRPVANTQIHILDDSMQPVPVGVAGELYIGGVQVGRGYLGRPELTAERFVRDPFTDTPDARLYRTGDLARHRADGAIEFLGRRDHQVKVRGFRIELGEIENALERHPAVAAAVVDVKDLGSGDPSIVAYVVRSSEGEAAGAGQERESEQVRHWEAIYDDAYGQQPVSVDPTFDTSGWNSSYSGAPVPAGEMREYVERTVERVLALKPRRVLEIGCGTGLLACRIAPHCDTYVGTDISRVALDKLAALARSRPELAKIQPLQRPADDFSGWSAEAFDVVVLNSVVQLFPSLGYLTRVLAGTARVVVPGGRIFVGDVRNLHLLPLFHASVQLHRAEPERTVNELRERIRRAAAREKDLVIAPEFFYSLPRRVPAIGHVEVELKRGHVHNEFTRFRYDVQLFVGQANADAPAVTLDWGQELAPADLRCFLAGERPELLVVSDVPNGRLVAELAALRALEGSEERDVASLRQATRTSAGHDIDPENLWALADGLPYATTVTWARSGKLDHVDVAFRRREPSMHPGSVMPLPSVSSTGKLAHEPLQSAFEHDVLPHLVAALRAELPEYMVPARFVVMDALPLTPSGKVDRAALPRPEEWSPRQQESYVAPRNPIETQLVAMWQELLGVPSVGVRDDFFALGGHSILAVRLTARMQQVFGRALPLASLFEGATVERLARLVQEEPSQDRTNRTNVLVPIRSQGVLQPFFCVHAGGGNVLAYRALAGGMAESRPFHAFQAVGIDGREPPLTDFRAMASRYLEEMQRVQPRGPYLLGGWCTGGRIAFEMARQLEARGERVDTLALFDAMPVPEGLPDGDALHESELLGSMSPQFARAAAAVADLPPDERLPRMIDDLRCISALPPEAGVVEIRQMLVVFRAMLRAERGFTPGTYGGRITLFRAEVQPRELARDFGWQRWAPAGADVIDVPGDHLSMMEDPGHALRLAAALEMHIDRPGRREP